MAIERQILALGIEYRRGRVHAPARVSAGVTLSPLVPLDTFAAPFSIRRSVMRAQEVLVDTLTTGAASSNTPAAAVAAGVAFAAAVAASAATTLLA